MDNPATPFVAAGLAGAIRGYGEYQGKSYEASKAKRAGEIARVQADQIDAQYREELSSTISNIRAIRASAGVGANSPSERAYIAEQERVSSRERRIVAGGKRMQANQYDSDSRFLRRSARFSLFAEPALGLLSAVK